MDKLANVFHNRTTGVALWCLLLLALASVEALANAEQNNAAGENPVDSKTLGGVVKIAAARKSIEQTTISKPTAKVSPKAQVTSQAMRLLQANCFACHNEDKKKGGLVLTSRPQLLRGGDEGPVAISGKPDSSKLVKALLPDADPHMPPKKQLATNQIDVLRKWIQLGAPWDEATLTNAVAIRQVKLGALPSSYAPVLALALTADGRTLALGRGRRIAVHDVTQTNYPIVADFEAHRDVVRSLAWNTDGRRLASGSFREITLWDAMNFQPLHVLTNGLAERVTALKFTPDSASLIAADGITALSGWVRIFSVENGQPIAMWQAHADTIFDLALSRDGERLATAGGDKLVKLWQVPSRTELARYEGHTGAVLGVAFNTNATELVSVGADKQIRVWDVQTRESVITIGGRKHSLNSVKWSENGKAIAAVSEAGQLFSFTDLKRHTGEQSSAAANEKQLAQWPETLCAVAVSADAKTIFAGSHDGSVYVVDDAGKLLAKLVPPEAISTAAKEAAEVKTESAKPSAAHSDLAAGDRNGLIRVVNTGEPIVRVRPGKDETAKKVNPKAKPASQPLSFVRDVMPLLSKAGCNAGSCHAKADGQNGFKLSVFSYDPKSDYFEIVKDEHSRRVFPAAPEESLILLKPTMTIEHGGGQRFEAGSDTHQTLVRWIREGMAYRQPDEPALQKITVQPHERRYRKGSTQRLLVQAHYSDGAVRDVTHLADFVANEKEIAKVDEHGVVRVGNLSGEGVVVARFMGFVDASRITVPADHRLPEARYAKLPVNNFIDEFAYTHFRKLGLFPSVRCTDAEFLRRSSLDAIGLLPAPDEARAFLADTASDKRTKWIDHLLAHPVYADYWANKWADLLRPNPDRVGVKSVYTLDQWLRESFRQNKPYDQFVRDILLAEGTNHRDGPVVIYRDRREPPELTTMFSQLFLGVRMECAKCHHHPNEKWSQDDFYQLAAYFGPLKQKGAGLSPPISAGVETFYFASGGSVKHPVTEEVMQPKPPDGPPASNSKNSDPRRALSDWMTDPANPFFAKAAVNRVWAVFFGRGIVEPVDDFRISNPATNEPLLNALAEDFAKHSYDLKHLLRTIMQSHLYQLSSMPNQFNLADTKNFSRAYRRRLPAEVLLDALNDVTSVPDEFSALPAGSRAMQAWSYKVSSHFMDAFGRPNSSSDCPCERDTRTSVVQSLHMMNSKNLQAKLASPEGRVKRLADSRKPPEEIVTELYLAAFARLPTADELKLAVAAYSAPEATRQTATEDVLWALLNSAEFVFNH